MIAFIGYGSLILTFVLAVSAAALALLSGPRGKPAWLNLAHSAALLTWPALTLAAICLVSLLVTDHYEIGYVANVTSRAMPLYLKVTAWWGGQAGSLLFWSWLMTTFAAAALLRRWEQDRDLLPVVIAVMMVTVGFFVALIVFFENPFAAIWITPAGETIEAMLQPAGAFAFAASDGRGLNPLLRHPGMIIHPPMLYTGFVSFVVPYAFAIAALVARRNDDAWIRTTRRWTLIGWLFLSLGLILGGRWAYDVLGWGGYWGWDPVENAAFLPWLTGTAFLHSVMIQEKRGMLKKWNMILIILTYALVIFGTFLTRSGVLSSVHAFAQSAIGPSFFIFIGLTFIVSLALLFREWDHLSAENQLTDILSRESAFLLNNVLFLGIAATVFWGTVFPMISELVTGQKISVGPPYYNQVTGPQFLVLVALMGIGPLLSWRSMSLRRLGLLLRVPGAVAAVVVIALAIAGMRDPIALVAFAAATLSAAATLAEFARGVRGRMQANAEPVWTALLTLAARNRRRYGGYVIHLGVLVMTAGIIASNLFQQETQGQLAPGEQLTVGRYVMVYSDLQQFTTDDDREVTRATVGVYRDGQLIDTLHPRVDFFVSSEQSMTIPGVRSAFEDDFYVLLTAWDGAGTGAATFKVYVNPLVNWVWAGGLIFILGTLIAAWPDAREPRRVTLPARAPAVTGD